MGSTPRPSVLRMDGNVGAALPHLHWEEIAAANKAFGQLAEAVRGEIEVMGAAGFAHFAIREEKVDEPTTLRADSSVTFDMPAQTNHGAFGVTVDRCRERADAKVRSSVNKLGVVRVVDLIHTDGDDIHQVMDNTLDMNDRLWIDEHLCVLEDTDIAINVFKPNNSPLIINPNEEVSPSGVAECAEGACKSGRFWGDRLELKDVAFAATESASEVRHGGLYQEADSRARQQ